MASNQEQLEQIERYLAGEMPEAERQTFEETLTGNPALAEALALHQALQHSLGNRQRRRLLDALADVAQQEDNKQSTLRLSWLSPSRLAAAAALVALVAAVGAWFYFRPIVEQATLVEQPSIPPAAAADSIQVVVPPSPIEQKPAPAPIASADRRAFAPNRALDPLAGALLRGGNEGALVLNLKNDAVFPIRNGKIDFALTGTADGMSALSLHIYNNSEADFAAGKPVYEYEIPLNDQAFSWEAALELAPGRYYAVLVAPGEEEPVLVVRFYVGSR